MRKITRKSKPIWITWCCYKKYTDNIAIFIASPTTSGGDVVKMVIDWLNAEAEKPEWIAFEDATRQGDLFA